jgi:hypothetical protein
MCVQQGESVRAPACSFFSRCGCCSDPVARRVIGGLGLFWMGAGAGYVRTHPPVVGVAALPLPGSEALAPGMRRLAWSRGFAETRRTWNVWDLTDCSSPPPGVARIWFQWRRVLLLLTHNVVEVVWCATRWLEKQRHIGWARRGRCLRKTAYGP